MNDARPRAKKCAVTLLVDADLLGKAKALGLNVSSVLEESLRVNIRQEGARRWLAENKTAIEILNEETRRHGLWSDRLRPF